MNNFELKILTQNWISNRFKKTDLCSHGKLELIIGNKTIISERDDIEWTINTSILKFLRCIESDHLAKRDFDIILHCGELLMLSCPIGIYFDLKHENDMVVINNIKKQFGVGESEYELMSEIEVKISKIEFAKKIIREAKVIKNFFNAQPKIIEDKRDMFIYTEFWREFDELLNNAIKKYSS